MSPNRKVISINNEGEYKRLNLDLFDISDKYIIQNIIRGHESNIYFCLTYFVLLPHQLIPLV